MENIIGENVVQEHTRMPPTLSEQWRHALLMVHYCNM